MTGITIYCHHLCENRITKFCTEESVNRDVGTDRGDVMSGD